MTTEFLNSLAKSMTSVMIAKFMLNDVPHALGLSNPEPNKQVATSRWQEILKYCHTLDDIRRIASGQGTIKVYHGAPTEFAELMVKHGPQVPYNIEDTARHVAKVYGLRWLEFAPYAFRKHEVRELLSTATAPIAARWAWSFPLGEVLTDLNAHARLVKVAVPLARTKGIKLRDAIDELYDKAEDIAKTKGIQLTTENTADVLGLEDKFALKAKTGALVELTLDIADLLDYVIRDAQYYIKDYDEGEASADETTVFWNHNYRDMRIHPDSIKSMRIVIRGMQPWEQDMIEDMIKEGKLGASCGI